ncbi:MAG: YhfC family glutamic-type intramembrane protease [Candidatus Aenigmatarchaeota archaeon]
MINPVFLLSGAGMMLLGILPVLWWRYRTLVAWKDFRLGAYLWLAAIGAKVLMDLSLTPSLVSWVGGAYTAAGIALVTGAYLGLRTGLLESGLTYLAGLKSRIGKFDFQQAAALGIAFGAAEAFMLGLSSFISVAVVLAFPQVVDLMPAAQRAAMLSQLSLPSIAAAAPVIERAAVLAVHAFCTILVVYSVKSGRAAYFAASFALRAMLDGTLPLLSLTLDLSTVPGMYWAEAFVAALGVASLAGIVWMKKRYKEKRKLRNEKKRLVLFTVALTVAVVAGAFVLSQPSAASPLERRTVNFDSFHGSYTLEINGTDIGRADFEYTGMTEYEGFSAFAVRESANLSGSGYGIYAGGTLYVTPDARPLFYNMTIRKDGSAMNVLCWFKKGQVIQAASEGNASRSARVRLDGGAFIMANNMISHWALLFRSARLEPKNTYIVRLYSPNAEAQVTRTLEVTGVETIKVGGRPYETYVFSEDSGSVYHVTPEGVLLMMESGAFRATLSDGLPEEGGMFR